MANPYEAAAADTSHQFRRAVRRYLVLSSFLLVFGLMVSYQGFALLFVPARTAIYDVEINGHPVSNEAAMGYTIGTGVVLVLVGLALCGKSFVNWRHNRRHCVNGG